MGKKNHKSDRDNITFRLLKFMQLAFLGESFRGKDLEIEFGVGDRTTQRDLKELGAHGFEFEIKKA